MVNKTNFHTVVSFFQPKCMVYACFVAKMSKMAFTRFGGQFQFEKSMLGRLDNSGAGAQTMDHFNFRGWLSCNMSGSNAKKSMIKWHTGISGSEIILKP